MRQFFILYLILSLTFSIAQHKGAPNDYSSYIKGTILDDETSKPIEYATIKIMNPDDSKIITGTISNTDGYFKLDGLTPGKYNITVEFIGYETIILTDQLIVPPNMIKDLGEIRLIINTIETDEVVIETEKPFIEEKLDKKVYNVEAMNLTTGGTADEVLDKLPSVSVNIDGNITLRGSSNVNIMIDGRMRGSENLDILDAGLVDQVEVITLPSSKYDPDGMAGIINIITNKNDYIGKSGKLDFSLGSWGTTVLRGTGNYFKDNLNIYSSLGFGDRKRKGNSARFSTATDPLTNNIMETINKTSTSNANNNNNNLFR